MRGAATTVLLVHGLWRTPLSFLSLVRRLRECGYRTERFGYAAIAQGYEVIVERLVRRLERLGDGGAPYVVIGHSLGGILLRSALARLTGPLPEHFVMLGTPNRSPRLARGLGVRWAYRRLMGESGANLASESFYRALPAPPVPYTIVAGTAGPRGRWSPFGDELNDGVVAVAETRIRDDDAIVVLRVTHTFMMNNAEVQAVIRRRIAGGEPA
jgi:pimeloyl-ACP methyl ester carboxylesterase